MTFHPLKMVFFQSVFLKKYNRQPLIPTTRFPILKENPEPLATLPLEIITFPAASAMVPSAKALKEAMTSHPALISAPKINFPAISAQILVAVPEPDWSPNAHFKVPFT